jgi:hypothetical protein
MLSDRLHIHWKSDLLGVIFKYGHYSFPNRIPWAGLKNAIAGLSSLPELLMSFLTFKNLSV